MSRELLVSDVEIGFIRIYSVISVWALTQSEMFAKIALLLNVEVIRPSGFSFPLCRIPLLVRGLFRKSRILRLSLLPPSLLSEVRERRVGPRVATCVASRGASSPPARLGPARGVEVLLDARPVLVGTSVSSTPSGEGVPGVARCGGCLLPALPRPQSVLPSYHCTPCEVMS